MKLREYAKEIGIDVGCGDSGCIWGGPNGMATNGGCRCLVRKEPVELRMIALRFARVATHLAARLESK